MVKDSYVEYETERSKVWRTEEDWIPDNIENACVAWAQCIRQHCAGRVAIMGRGGVEDVLTSENEWDTVEIFTPVALFPMPAIINIPLNCPLEVRGQLQEAFTLFYTSPPACAGRIRVAIELLLTTQKIASRKLVKGLQRELSLHERIELFAKKNSDIAHQLMALKWLGNSGSHPKRIRVQSSDVLDAFEILEHALFELIERRTERIAQLAKGLMDRHRTSKSKKHKGPSKVSLSLPNPPVKP
jgi:hypothetical protein